MEIYEAWGSINENATCFSTVEGCQDMKMSGIIEEECVPLFSIRAKSWTEAMTLYHEIQGWELYKPFIF